MDEEPTTYPPTRWDREIREARERCLKATARAMEVLKLERPDTFLGRSTYDPFPKEEQ
jgi:hypothetical protein